MAGIKGNQGEFDNNMDNESRIKLMESLSKWRTANRAHNYLKKGKGTGGGFITSPNNKLSSLKTHYCKQKNLNKAIHKVVNDYDGETIEDNPPIHTQNNIPTKYPHSHQNIPPPESQIYKPIPPHEGAPRIQRHHFTPISQVTFGDDKLEGTPKFRGNGNTRDGLSPNMGREKEDINYFMKGNERNYAPNDIRFSLIQEKGDECELPLHSVLKSPKQMEFIPDYQGILCIYIYIYI